MTGEKQESHHADSLREVESAVDKLVGTGQLLIQREAAEPGQ